MTAAFFRRVSSNVLEGVFANPARIKTVLFPSSSETVVDDDVLLTIAEGHEHVDSALQTQAFIRSGGTRIGDIDVGAGPARGFRSADVRKLAAKLTLISVEDFERTLNGTPLPPQAPPIKELVAAYSGLRELVIETAKAEAGMIVYLG